MQDTERAWLFDTLGRLAQGVAAVVGPHCEVVVHDFRDLEHSVVFVAGNLTGRKPGAPVPDLSFLEAELTQYVPDQLNYLSRRGARTLHSSTVWIRDSNETPVGAVCINVDYSRFEELRGLLDQVTTPARDGLSISAGPTFARDTDDLVELSMTDYFRREGIEESAKMSHESKLRLIQYLEARGLFRIRGTVNRVARSLHVSRATIYNYRSSIPANQPATPNQPMEAACA